MSAWETCPACKVDLRDKPIPQEWRDKGYYGDKTHFLRTIAIYDENRDCTVAYECPDCGHRSDRTVPTEKPSEEKP